MAASRPSSAGNSNTIWAGRCQGNLNPGAQRLDSFGQNLRRGRLFFGFKYDDLQLNLTPDFGGSPDGTVGLYEANLNWSPVKPLTLTLGYFKPWITLQDSMSSNDFLFLERPEHRRDRPQHRRRRRTVLGRRPLGAGAVLRLAPT